MGIASGRTCQLRRRKVITRHGTFIINWTPAEVEYLLASENLIPEDLLVNDRQHLRRLIRDLFLLGLSDELSRGMIHRDEPPRLAQFARTLARLVEQRVGNPQ